MQDPVAGSAAVAQGMVYIGSMDGFLYALDAATGKLIWKFKTQEQPLSPPAFAAGTLFFSSTEGSLYALHARTGQTRLRFRTPDRLHDSPVVANGLVYFPSGGQIYAVAADAREFPGQYQLTTRLGAVLDLAIPGASAARPARGQVAFFPPATSSAGLSPHQQWPLRRCMWVIPMAIFMLGML